MSRRFTLRVDEDELAQWRSSAQAAGMPVAEWVRARCRGGDPSPRVTPKEAKVRIDARPIGKQLIDVIGPAECHHPRSKRKVLGYGTFCECGERLR